MTIRTAITAVLLGASLLSYAAAQQAAAQPASVPQVVSDQDIQLIRKTLQSTKKQIIAANMLLTNTEAQNFWPVYDQYTAELASINDAKASVIKDYAANFDNLTDDQASILVTRWAEADQSAAQLRTKYLPMFRKVLSGRKAARLFQIDRRIDVLVDLQLSSEIPLVEPN